MDDVRLDDDVVMMMMFVIVMVGFVMMLIMMMMIRFVTIGRPTMTKAMAAQRFQVMMRR